MGRALLCAPGSHGMVEMVASAVGRVTHSSEDVQEVPSLLLSASENLFAVHPALWVGVDGYSGAAKAPGLVVLHGEEQGDTPLRRVGVGIQKHDLLQVDEGGDDVADLILTSVFADFSAGQRLVEREALSVELRDCHE